MMRQLGNPTDKAWVAGWDFEDEAVRKLRDQITKELIEFTSRPAEGKFRPEIRTAILRVVR